MFDISRRRIHILSIYAPTIIDAHANETMSFYDRLSSIVDEIPSRDHLFLCGDFNATLPVDKVCVKNRCGEANCNTKMLQSFIERHDLLAANAYTRLKHCSLPTFDGPNGCKTRLDWIFCPLHYRCNLQKSNTLKTSVITSDHRFVTASFSLKWPVRKSRSMQIDWTSLITPDIRFAFVTVVRQEIDSWSDFRLAVLHASVRHLPFKRHSSFSWLQDDPQILNAKKTVQGACRRYGQASTEHRVSLINLDEAYTRCAEEFAQNAIDDIEKHTLECRSAEAWKAINLFCGGKFRFTNCVNAESIDNMKLRIKDHHAAVLNQAPSGNLVRVFSDSSPLTNKYDYSFTIPKIHIALRTSRSNTASGSDGIPTRVLQLCELEEDVLNVINSHSILSNNDNTVPDKWKHSIIVSIPKKGNSSSLVNQHGIAKSCAFAKQTNKLLLARIRVTIVGSPKWFSCWSVNS